MIDQKTKLSANVLLRVWESLTAPVSTLEGISLVVWHGLPCQMVVRDMNPTHNCQNATTAAGAGHAKSFLKEKPVCNHSAPITNLQTHPRIPGHPNGVISLHFLEGWRWELSPSLVCVVYLLSVCPSVVMENGNSSIFLWRPLWRLGWHNNYLTLSDGFREF